MNFRGVDGLANLAFCFAVAAVLLLAVVTVFALWG